MAYEDELAAFRARRAARLAAPDGWFTLVDRIWLEPGDNPLPIGVLRVQGEALSLRAAPGVTRAGAPISGEVEVRGDDQPPIDRFELGGLTYDVARGVDRLSVRVRDPEAPARRAFAEVPAFALDPRWLIAARFEAYPEPRPVDTPFSTGELAVRLVPGALVLPIDGVDHRVEPLIEPNPDRLFILFGDLTNRTGETYGGGRLLYAPLPEGDRAVIDFNRALNPACVFNPLAICPLPPRGNRLPVRIEAGEQMYRGPVGGGGG